jgi:asparagine synthetase A
VVVWLKEGNTNTKEFHGSIKVEEKIKQYFLALKSMGIRVEDVKDVKMEVFYH